MQHARANSIVLPFHLVTLCSRINCPCFSYINIAVREKQGSVKIGLRLIVGREFPLLIDAGLKTFVTPTLLSLKNMVRLRNIVLPSTIHNLKQSEACGFSRRNMTRLCVDAVHSVALPRHQHELGTQGQGSRD